MGKIKFITRLSLSGTTLAVAKLAFGISHVRLSRLGVLLILWSAAGATQVAQAPIPTSSEEHLQWLEKGAYLSWPSESAPHPSRGPHFGDVRTYVNLVLFESLQASRSSHPKGAVAVKELYSSVNASSAGALDQLLQSGPRKLQGWAVSVKLADDSARGKNWYWFEFVKKYQVADGVGEAACIECHQQGRDYILTDWPFRY